MSESSKRPAWRTYAGPLATLICVGIVASAYRPELEAWFGVEERGAVVKAEHDHDTDEVAHYTCPMHPSVKAAEMGACPICNMDLVAVTRADLEASRLTMDPARLQQLGVKSESVSKRRLSEPVVAQGELVADETRTSEVTLLSSGWIRRLRVEETGEYVARGQTLLELYSPAIVAASDEYIAAHRATGSGRERMIKAARRKLGALGVSDRQIRRLESRERSPETVAISAPNSGYVVEKFVAEGSKVDAGTVLFSLAELDRLWVDAQVYERDWMRVRKGAKASVSLTHGGKSYPGTVDLVHPALDPQTRTVRVRVVLDEAVEGLLAGMYARVEIESESVESLALPRDAVIYTGPRRLVFVDLGEGRLEPREVKLGGEYGEWVEVESGVREGDRVVRSGAFLIAAESRIRSAQELWAPETQDPEDEAAPASVAPKAAYVCPMHPEITSDEPGSCSICKMDLMPTDAYACPMHPEITSHKPGSCSICKMDLVPTERGDGHEGH